MKPMANRQPKEAAIQAKIRRALEAAGWLVEKTHGNAYQAGWPDIFAYKPRHDPVYEKLLDRRDEATGRVQSTVYRTKPNDFATPEMYRWIEVKRPKRSRLTRAQVVRFTKWEAHGLGVWVLDSADMSPLEQKPNWRDYL